MVEDIIIKIIQKFKYINDLQIFWGDNLAEEKEVGKVTHYFSKMGVGVVKVSGNIKERDTIHIKGITTDFQQKVRSMQIEHEEVKEAKKGQSIGLKVDEQVREHDTVYKVVE